MGPKDLQRQFVGDGLLMLLGGPSGSIPPGEAILGPLEHALAVQAVQRGHHGGVGPLARVGQAIGHLTNRQARFGPDDLHDARFEFAEWSHAASGEGGIA